MAAEAAREALARKASASSQSMFDMDGTPESMPQANLDGQCAAMFRSASAIDVVKLAQIAVQLSSLPSQQLMFLCHAKDDLERLVRGWGRTERRLAGSTQVNLHPACPCTLHGCCILAPPRMLCCPSCY